MVWEDHIEYCIGCEVCEIAFSGVGGSRAMMGAVVGVLGGVVFAPSRLLRLASIGRAGTHGWFCLKTLRPEEQSPHDYNSHPPLEGSFLRIRLDHKGSFDLVGLRYDRSDCIEESSSLFG
jgi:hypothetical protein